MNNVYLFTGGFDPIHSGHIEAIKHAQSLGKVVLGLNSDQWLIRKKGQAFMPFSERKAVLDQFKGVLAVISFDDNDNTACDAIEQTKEQFLNHKIIFVNGGDRTQSNIPEMERFKDDPLVDISYGRGVGYTFTQHDLGEEIHQISATKIRAQLRSDGKLL